MGLRPKPRLVACGDPYAPRRFLAGAHVRAVLKGSVPHPGSVFLCRGVCTRRATEQLPPVQERDIPPIPVKRALLAAGRQRDLGEAPTGDDFQYAVAVPRIFLGQPADRAKVNDWPAFPTGRKSEVFGTPDDFCGSCEALSKRILGHPIAPVVCAWFRLGMVFASRSNRCFNTPSPTPIYRTPRDAIARELNTRPRKALGHRTPADLLAETVASTG